MARAEAALRFAFKMYALHKALIQWSQNEAANMEAHTES